MKIRLATLVAISALTMSTTAGAEMVRAFWADDLSDAISGFPLELALGDAIDIETSFANEWDVKSLTRVMLRTAPAAAQASKVSNREAVSASSALQVLKTGIATKAFEAERELSLVPPVIQWEADDVAMQLASRAVELAPAPRVLPPIPIPATLPLMLGALGLLAGMRRRS